MEMPTRPASGSQEEVPKDNTQDTSSNSPPPAYTPPRSRTLGLAALAALEIQHSQAHQQHQLPQTLRFVRPMWATSVENQDEGGEDEGTPPISLRINTSVNVSKSNNIICLAATPADHANSIAEAVVQAIQKHSSGQCGIPMIDEEGRPRPVNIEVDASMVVEGSGNIIGGQDVISRVLSERSQQHRLMRVRPREDYQELHGTEAEGSEMPAKRRRSS